MLTLLCVVSAGAGIAYAQRSETYEMKTGHSYLVPIQAWMKDNNGKDALASSNLNSALQSCSNDAIVTPEESGKYQVTIQANNYDKMVTFQIYKQGMLKADTSTSDFKCASYGLDDYPFREKMIETGWLDTANDEKCYSPDEISVEGNDYSANKYLTFEVDNLKDFLYTAQIEYYPGSSNHWTKERARDLTRSKLSFDTSNIIELPEKINEYKNGGVKFDFVSHRVTDNYNFEGDGQKLNSLITGIVTADGNSALVKLNSNGNVNIKNIYINSVPEEQSYGGSYTRYRGVSEWNELEVKDGTVEIPYNSVKEAVFGREIHVVFSDDSEYYATLKLDTDQKETVTLSSNGVTLTSDSYNLKKETKFEATPVTKGTDYENAMSSVGGVSSAAKLYSLSFKAKDIAYTPNNRVTLAFDIPEDWDADKTQLYVFYADEKTSANINSEYGEVNVENGKLNYTTTKLDGY